MLPSPFQDFEVTACRNSRCLWHRGPLELRGCRICSALRSQPGAVCTSAPPRQLCFRSRPCLLLPLSSLLPCMAQPTSMARSQPSAISSPKGATGQTALSPPPSAGVKGLVPSPPARPAGHVSWTFPTPRGQPAVSFGLGLRTGTAWIGLKKKSSGYKKCISRATPSPERKPNCVCQILFSAPASTMRLSKMEANNLYPIGNNEIGR